MFYSFIHSFAHVFTYSFIYVLMVRHVNGKGQEPKPHPPPPPAHSPHLPPARRPSVEVKKERSDRQTVSMYGPCDLIGMIVC